MHHRINCLARRYGGTSLRKGISHQLRMLHICHQRTRALSAWIVGHRSIPSAALPQHTPISWLHTITRCYELVFKT
eukprot:1850353-Amphidinium_carterae.1